MSYWHFSHVLGNKFWSLLQWFTSGDVRQTQINWQECDEKQWSDWSTFTSLFRSVSPRDPTECQNRESDGSPWQHSECSGPVGGPQGERLSGPPLQGDLEHSRNTPKQPEPGRTDHRWGKPSWAQPSVSPLCWHILSNTVHTFISLLNCEPAGGYTQCLCMWKVHFKRMSKKIKPD